jgi:hypothetical protein
MAFDGHVVGNIDPGVLPLGIFIGWDGKRSEGGTVTRLTKLLAGAREVFEGTGIQGQPEGSAGGIDRRQGEERGVPEPGQHPARHDLDADLHRSLIAGLGRASGEKGNALRLGEGRIGAIARGSIAMGSDHGRLAGIRDDTLGARTENRQGPNR